MEEAYLKDSDKPPFISVKGEMVDGQYVEEDHIAGFLINKIVDLFTLGPGGYDLERKER
jgi:hypothetical protein